MKIDQDNIPHPLIYNKYGFEKSVGQPILPSWTFAFWGVCLGFCLGSTLIFNIWGLKNVCAKFHTLITVYTIAGTWTLTNDNYCWQLKLNSSKKSVSTKQLSITCFIKSTFYRLISFRWRKTLRLLKTLIFSKIYLKILWTEIKPYLFLLQDSDHLLSMDLISPTLYISSISPSEKFRRDLTREGRQEENG